MSGAVRDDLETVFRREYGVVVGVAARVLGSVDAAEDVAQEVFLSFGRTSVPVAEDECHGGLSYAEVAASLDISPGSVGTTVRRAEAALRRELRHASSD